jgi:hypothetical protein
MRLGDAELLLEIFCDGLRKSYYSIPCQQLVFREELTFSHTFEDETEISMNLFVDAPTKFHLEDGDDRMRNTFIDTPVGLPDEKETTKLISKKHMSYSTWTFDLTFNSLFEKEYATNDINHIQRMKQMKEDINRYSSYNPSEDDLIMEYEEVLQYYIIPEDDKPKYYLCSLEDKKKTILMYKRYIQDKSKSDESLQLYIDNLGVPIASEDRKKLFGLSLGERERLLKNEMQKTSGGKKQRIPIPRNYEGFKVNFYSVFSNASMKKAFMEHLKKEYSLETFDFAVAVDLVGNDSSPENVRKFMEICDTFIQPKSKKEVNLPANLRETMLQLRSNIKVLEWESSKPPKEYLTPVRTAIINDLIEDPFTRFINSDLGYEVICENSGDDYVISKNPIYLILFKLNNVQDGSTEVELFELASTISNGQKISKLFNFYEDSVDLSILFVPYTRVQQKSTFKSLLGVKSDEDELYTSGLLVGDMMLEWKQDLVVPRKITPTSEVIAIKFATLKIGEFQQKSSALFGLIADWNVNMKNGDNEKTASAAQVFVDAALNSLGVAINGAIVSELCEGVRKRGVTEMYFKISNDFQKKFKLKERRVVFNRHNIMDEFMLNLLEVDENFEVNHPIEHAFFKQVDALFWKRWLIFDKEKKKRSFKLGVVVERNLPSFLCCFKEDYVDYKLDHK